MGFGAATPYTSLLALIGQWGIFNDGVGGQTLATLVTHYQANVAPYYNRTSPKNVIVLWAITNDYAANPSLTASAAYSLFTQYVAAAHQTGFKVIVVTMISRTGLDTQKNAINPLILANTAGADGIVDMTATKFGCDGCFADTSVYQNDGIHPNQNGITTIEGPKISTAINALP